jgi:malonate transporter MadL subunit
MEIYGLGITAASYFIGNVVGEFVGKISGIGGNIGGVGFGMFFLVFVASFLEKKNLMGKKTSEGIKFLSAIYISVIVAMAASQNVVAAIKGGPAALLAGGLATFIGLFVVVPISRIGGKPEPLPENTDIQQGD